MGNGASNEPNGVSLVGSTIPLRQGDSCSVDKQLAVGGFSVVLVCTRKSDGRRIALKRIKAQSKESELEALSEVRSHALLGNDQPCCEYIVPLVETRIEKNGKDGREISLFFPLYTRGSLSDHLLERPKSFIVEEKACLSLFLTCAKAVAGAHAKGVAHCDVKPHNFMMSEDGVSCILIDFGSSRGPPVTKRIETRGQALIEQERAERFCSASFRAPELWDVPHKGYELDFSKSDIFALGCVLYSMVFRPFGYSPFESPAHGIMSLAARTASYSFPESEDGESIPEVRGMKDLITRMLDVNPSKRPTGEQVVEAVMEALQSIAEEDFDVDFATSSSHG